MKQLYALAFLAAVLLGAGLVYVASLKR